MLIYKIADADGWLKVFEDGPFEGTAKDKEDGFIHFSTGEQLIETLKLHYASDDYERMLAISEVNADILGANLKWEPSRNCDLFPHLYSPLPKEAVRNTLIVFYKTLAESDFAVFRDFVSGKSTSEQS